MIKQVSNLVVASLIISVQGQDDFATLRWRGLVCVCKLLLSMQRAIIIQGLAPVAAAAYNDTAESPTPPPPPPPTHTPTLPPRSSSNSPIPTLFLVYGSIARNKKRNKPSALLSEIVNLSNHRVPAVKVCASSLPFVAVRLQPL